MFNYITKIPGVNSYGQATTVTKPRIGKIVGHIILAIVILTFVFGSFGTINAGERGVKTRLGALVGTEQPGLYFKMPFLESVTTMDVRTQSIVATQQEPMAAASHDLQDTRLAVVVNYHIDPTMVTKIYQQNGDARTYYNSVVNPLITATIKAVASQYTAAEQIQKRAEMSTVAFDALTKAFDGKNVIIEKIDITNVQFSESFTHAIEAKVTAVQNAEAANNKLAQVKAEAQQKIETAKADAEAIRIQAQAVTQQGGADYVKLQELKYWNGSRCTTYCFGEGQTPPAQILNNK